MFLFFFAVSSCVSNFYTLSAFSNDLFPDFAYDWVSFLFPKFKFCVRVWILDFLFISSIFCCHWCLGVYLMKCKFEGQPHLAPSKLPLPNIIYKIPATPLLRAPAFSVIYINLNKSCTRKNVKTVSEWISVWDIKQ